MEVSRQATFLPAVATGHNPKAFKDKHEGGAKAQNIRLHDTAQPIRAKMRQSYLQIGKFPSNKNFKS